MCIRDSVHAERAVQEPRGRDAPNHTPHRSRGQQTGEQAAVQHEQIAQAVPVGTLVEDHAAAFARSRGARPVQESCVGGPPSAAWSSDAKNRADFV
eukprot:1232677-Prymnesium_polylepis.1